MENPATIVADDILSFHSNISATAKSDQSLFIGLWNINEHKCIQCFGFSAYLE